MRLPGLILGVMLMMASPAVADEAATKALNQIRAAKGLGAVSYSRTLEKAALGHARDMNRKNFFSHKGSNGSTVGKRVRRVGYKFCIVAENIAKGQKDLKTVMQGWRDSPSHMKNMSLRKVREFALVRDGDVWVMVLGARKC